MTSADLASPSAGVRSRASVVINGKFLSAAPTGVHRVAAELIRATAARLGRLPKARSFKMLKPRDAHHALGLAQVPEQVVGLTTWQVWEQTELAWNARHDLLLSLCNLAPLAHPASIVMIHDAQVFASPESYAPAFRAWYRAALPRLGKRSLQVLTVSEFSAAQLVHYGVAAADRISVVPNGGDHLLRVDADGAVIERLKLAGRPYVVALANTQAHKNIAVLLEAFRDPRLAGTRLVLVGGADAAAFAAAGAPPGEGVVFAGKVSDAELRALLESAVCLAFPSRTEGFGLPPAEAMSLGCPTVIAPRGALPEVCGDAALQVDPDDVAGWADAFVELQRSPATRAQLSEAGRRRAALFTWDKSAERLLDVVNRFSA